MLLLADVDEEYSFTNSVLLSQIVTKNKKNGCESTMGYPDMTILFSKE